MTLTKTEITEIEKIAKDNPAIAKLWKDWNEMQDDVEQTYKTAHKTAMKYVADGVKNKTLNLKEDYDAAVMEFLVKAKPIREGMDALKTDEGGLPKEGKQIPRKQK